MAGPLEQFEIKPIVRILIEGVDLSFTNSALWMVIAVAAVYYFVVLGTRQHALVPGRLQSLVELSYEFVAGLVRENAGKEGMRFFPLIFTLFMFIFMGNMLGMIPGSFTFTSHIIVTFFMALCVWVGVTVYGFYLHGARFLTFFAPSGAPVYMLPLLVPIEILSYCVRPISLSVRLFVNMMAGHTMMKVFAGFIIALGVFGVAPLAIAVALTGFEFAVAFLQAYVFTVLTCLYLHDAIHMH
ncbi:MAG: F0F1 ATP synthase subunit A [Geminicoccaceae bacterium]|nr:F0F1 ATP synthase subunit A [Geminicoccaceae bacterium]HRY23856.1 F0F1 ATP synthase subunit A [Geminicoccaceae bacterium]